MRKEPNRNSGAKHPAATISPAHLLHPAMHFDHPHDVLIAGGVSKDEKRAILASWASDICAIESMPAWRRYPGTERIVSYDEVLASLKALDRDDQITSAQEENVSLLTAEVDPLRANPAASDCTSTGRGGVADSPSRSRTSL